MNTVNSRLDNVKDTTIFFNGEVIMKNFKKSSAVILFSLFSTMASAETFYGQANVGIKLIDADSSNADIPSMGSIALSLRGGMNLFDLTGIKGVSIEGEYSKDVYSSPSSSESDYLIWADAISNTSTLSSWGAGVYGAYSFAFSQKFSIKGRLGVVYSNSTLTKEAQCFQSSFVCGDFVDTKSELSGSSVNLAYGAAINYAFTDSVAATIGFTKLNTQIDDTGFSNFQVEGGVIMRF